MTTLLAATHPTTTHPTVTSAEAEEHFAKLLQFETDCYDVHEALQAGNPGFVVIDVRGPQAFAKAHVPGAINLPHGKMNERSLAAYPAETLFVVYCSGPHCNGADKGALRLSRLGRPVRKMLGGMSGWLYEGHAIETTE